MIRAAKTKLDQGAAIFSQRPAWPTIDTYSTIPQKQMKFDSRTALLLSHDVELQIDIHGEESIPPRYAAKKQILLLVL